MKRRFETLAVHGGYEPEAATRSRAVPLYRTTSYTFDSARQAADIFALEEPGFFYTRVGNPTQQVLEERLALLESCGLPASGASALALASGTSAIFYAVITLARQGDDIVSAGNLYGGTHTMFTHLLPQFGIKVHLAPVNDIEAMAAQITPATRALYIEAIGNPGLDVADIAAYADLARAVRLPLIVDATFATPALLRPLEYGAHIVIHSLTKWIGGHGAAIGGIVVDGADFEWHDPRFPLFSEPDESYHGLVWGACPLPPYITRMRTAPLRNLGACISPDNAWLFLQGLESLALRMERHSSNALAVARYLEKHPQVAWVRYPGLEGDPAHELARRYLPRGCGGMVVFGLAGRGREQGLRFVDKLRLFSHLANVGDARSLVLHPASTTHAQLSEEEQRTAGIKPELVRLSIGLEHPDDILEDLEQALGKI
ncbi:O-acetylhomoserine aminocarboxypropyltransferase/cysteine synthase [Desulfovibrio sp. OttesenSCG-928-M16]|nr:O-acetylhomoserine aminocarboxypropyltransferase/cysteine synthase [Desulfovibrio sp. OttesenSCG-928-M16]